MYKIWYGSEASFEVLATANTQMQALLKANPNIDDQFELPSLYKLDGSVGVVSVKGSLVSGDAGWRQLFGVSGYDNIATALVDSVSDKKAKSIMLDIDSPGGSAKGVNALGNLIKDIGSVKPMSAYGDNIGSAAYWAGSAAKHITLDEMGMAGSIGALIVHSERSKQLEQDGIKVKVIRAGVNKALANSVEPLSAEGEADLQAIVNTSRDMFVAAVADNLGVTSATVESQMGQGKMLMGAAALSAGLVHKIGTYEDALAHSTGLQASFKPTKQVKV